MKSFRIDPANESGIHIVDVENGGVPVLIPYDNIPLLINELEEVLKSKKGI